MSSTSNMRLAYIAESTYGVTPGTGNFDVIRASSEGVSGTPSYVQSTEVRSDRQPTGQTLVGLDIDGQVSGLLAPTQWVTDWIESAMRDTWNAKITTGATSLDITTSGTVLSRAAGSFVTDGFKAGDLIQLSGFTNAANNAHVYVSAVAATALTIVGSGLVDETGGGDEVAVRHAYVEIGDDQTSFSMARTYQDDSVAASYRGVLPASMNVRLQTRQQATIDFSVVGGGPDPYDPSTDITASRTVNDAGTESPLSAAHVGFVVADGALAAYCTSNFALSLNNNYTAKNCMGGALAPKGQTVGEATVNITLTAYHDSGNHVFLEKKAAGTPVSVLVPVIDSSGEGYAFAVAAFKPAGRDPGITGKNAQGMLELTGVAEPTATRNALRVYHITQS